MAELKPCPFCGGEAEGPYHYDPYDGYQGDCGSYTVECSHCRMLINQRTKQEAIEVWNRRAESEELKFTRKFIHEHGLDFALASAWNRRAEDGK